MQTSIQQQQQQQPSQVSVNKNDFVNSLMQQYMIAPSQPLAELIIHELSKTTTTTTTTTNTTTTTTQQSNVNNKDASKKRARDDDLEHTDKRSKSTNLKTYPISAEPDAVQVCWMNFEEQVLQLRHISNNRLCFASPSIPGKATQRQFVHIYRLAYPTTGNLDLGRICLWLKGGSETLAVRTMLLRLPRFLAAVKQHGVDSDIESLPSLE